MIMFNFKDCKFFSDKEIDKLLFCEKRIVSTPKRKSKSNLLHKEIDFQVEANEGLHKFTVFIRENTMLIEAFSIGLVYHPDSESAFRLIRYNGDHGQHRNMLTGEKINGFHIHKTTHEAILKDIEPDNFAEQTKKYTTIQGAMKSFFEDLNINNYLDYFSELSNGTVNETQLGLNFDE